MSTGGVDLPSKCGSSCGSGVLWLNPALILVVVKSLLGISISLALTLVIPASTVLLPPPLLPLLPFAILRTYLSLWGPSHRSSNRTPLTAQRTQNGHAELTESPRRPTVCVFFPTNNPTHISLGPIPPLIQNRNPIRGHLKRPGILPGRETVPRLCSLC